VLAGDHRQLPPFSNLPSPMKTMLERGADKLIPTTLLELQYRMRPAISLWPSSTFYESKLQNHESVSHRPELEDGIVELKWVDTSDLDELFDEEITDSKSFKNNGEAAAIVAMLPSYVSI